MEEQMKQYLNHLYPEDPILNKILLGIRDQGMPEISIAPQYGRLLTLLVRAQSDETSTGDWSPWRLQWDLYRKRVAT